MSTTTWRRRAAAAMAVTLVLAGTACGSDDEPQARETTTTAAPAAAAEDEVLDILVTNDDGYAADGIDAVVRALLELEDVEVTVVAPAENQSGSGDSTLGGDLVAAEVETRSGYAATSVAGKPADSVNHALDALGLEPDLVVSGTNIGQNIGPFSQVSGTVGAAKTAARRGIPALAVSTGVVEGTSEHGPAAELAAEWVEEHREAILAGELGPLVESINVPTCTAGELKELVEVPLATDFADRDAGTQDCTSTVPASDLRDDVDAFNHGYPSLVEVPFE